jgi:hypothetical protein
MPRGDHKTTDDMPYRVWLVLVDPSHRIRIPLAEVKAVVPWVTSESEPIDCIASLGPAGGIQVEPAASYEAMEGSYVGALGDAPPQSAESGQTWVEMARLLATSWRMTISIESSRINITLPEPVRKAKQVPEAGGLAVVFGFGGILEVWDAAKWHDHVRMIAKTKLPALSAALEYLRNR